eukprot:scaffold442_cov268-Pinguiococcus_pyrenoidosus.AAC.34
MQNKFGALAELEATLSNGSDTRWLVLDLADESEETIAACQIRMAGDAEERKCEILVLATAVEGKGLATFLLKKVAGIAASLGAKALECRIPHLREDVYGWLEHRGFTEVGGGPWAEIEDAPTRIPVSYICMECKLGAFRSKPTRPKQIVKNPSADGMANLIGTLFEQLHAEKRAGQADATSATIDV